MQFNTLSTLNHSSLDINVYYVLLALEKPSPKGVSCVSTFGYKRRGIKNAEYKDKSAKGSCLFIELLYNTTPHYYSSIKKNKDFSSSVQFV